MPRPRKRDKGLPAYVRVRHGSYIYKDQKLCRVEAGEVAMYEALAKRKQLGALDMIPAAVAAFKLDHLPTLSASARGEHKRLLDIFAEEFSEYRVEQVDSQDIKRSCKNLYSGRPSAAKHYKARISTFYRWCITDCEALKGRIKVNPCKEVWLEKPIAKKTPWTDALFWAVRDRLSPMLQCYHDLSFLLYQRTTDVRRLLRSQAAGDVVHFAPSKVRNSSGREVDIPITPEIRAVLERAAQLSKEIAKEYEVISPFVIHTTKGAPYTRSGIHSAYRRVDEDMHGKRGPDGKWLVPPLGLNPKALLPYACTSAKRQGFGLPQIQVGRAHTSIKTTEGYIQQHEVPVSEVRMTLPKRP